MNPKKRKVLYLPSTPLNLLVSVAHALAYSSEQRAQIVLIDQKSRDENVYFKALTSWSNSPFERVELTLGLAKKGKEKLNERKANFLSLSKVIKNFPADVIAVGSDRRVEFQYAMHLRSKVVGRSNIEGWYLDDGLYSYAGRPYKWFKDVVNSLLKKLAYGFWWEEPQTVGASNWINQAWLFSPENSISAIKQKKCHPILSEWFLNKEMSQFLEFVLNDYGVGQKMQSKFDAVDLFILIPHPNNLLKMDRYIERLECFLEKTKGLELAVMVKYHPRENKLDSLNLMERYDVMVVPSSLAFEFILPKLPQESIILGDISTVLMTAKWLRPDVTTFAILNPSDQFAQQFRGTLEKLGISMISKFEESLLFVKKKMA